MATLQKYALSSNGTTGTTWATTSNALTSASGTYATHTSSTANAVGTMDLRGYDFSTIPAGSVINSVTIGVKGHVGTVARQLAPQAQVFVGGVALGAVQTLSTLLTTSTTVTETFQPSVKPTLAQLQDPTFSITFTSRKANSTQSGVQNLDFIYVTVDYTVPVDATFSGTTGNADAAGGNGALSTGPRLIYRGRYEATDFFAPSYANVPIGTPTADRIVIVVAGQRDSPSGSATINVNGSPLPNLTLQASYIHQHAIAWGVVSAGTTATIDVNWTSQTSNRIQVWTLENAGAGVTQQTATFDTAGAPVAAASTVGGWVLGTYYALDLTGSPINWTGLTEQSELSTSNIMCSAADTVATSTTTTVSAASTTAGNANPVVAVLSLAPPNDGSARFSGTTGDAAAAGGTGAMTGSATFSGTTGDAAADGGMGAMTATSTVNATFSGTTGDAAADGGSGALTGSATFSGTVGDAAASGGSGALTGSATFSGTTGDAPAAGGTGALTGSATFSGTTGDAAADGGSGALTGSATFSGTTGDAAAAGGTGAMTGSATFSGTTGDAAADGGVGSMVGGDGTVSATFSGTTGDAAAAGGSGALTGSATFSGTTGDATADGGVGALTVPATFTATVGTATADGGAGAMTGSATFSGTTGSATADGGQGSMSAVNPVHATFTGTTGDATADGGVGALTGSATFSGTTGDATADGGQGSMYVATRRLRMGGNTVTALRFGTLPVKAYLGDELVHS